MKDIGPRPVKNAPADRDSQVDVEIIIEQIFSDLGGVTSRADIRKALIEVAPKYDNARIKIYVPIFLRRDAIRRLQGGLTHSQRAEAPKPQNAASSKAADSAREETVKLATNYTGPELLPAQSS